MKASICARVISLSVSVRVPLTDALDNAAAGHRIISFMDGTAGYNQIFMAEEDIPKTAFRCPGHVGLFKWIVMTFGLKMLVLLIRGP